jgi:hypothetical protein
VADRVFLYDCVGVILHSLAEIVAELYFNLKVNYIMHCVFTLDESAANTCTDASQQLATITEFSATSNGMIFILLGLQ